MLDNEPTGVPGEQPDSTPDTQDAATTAATNEAEAPKRPRRRTASRPAGPPSPEEQAEANASAAAAESEAKPKRARKTAAKKVAAPELAAQTEPAAQTESAAQSEAAEAGEPAAKKTTRTRTRKKAAEAEPVASQATETTAEPAAAADDADVAPTTRARTRRRATSAGTAAEQAPSAEQATGAEASQSAASQSAEESGTTRRRTRSAADRGKSAEAAETAATATRAETAPAATTSETTAAETAAAASGAGTAGAPRTRTRRRATSAGTAAEQAPAAEQAATTAASESAAPEQAAESASRPAGLTSPFTNPFAAPQLPAQGTKAAQQAPAEQPAQAEAKTEAKAETKTEAKAATRGRTRSGARAETQAEAGTETGTKAGAKAEAGTKPDTTAEADQQPAAESTDSKPKRTRRRAASAPAGPPRPHEGDQAQQLAAEAEDTEADQATEPVDLASLSPAERARAIIAARAAAPAAGVLFQAPDLTTAVAQKAAVKAAKADTADAEAEAESAEGEAEAEEEQAAPTRRTRTRNRNRNRAEHAETAPADAAARTDRADSAEDDDDEDDDEEGGTNSSRRRRRRRRRAGGEAVEASPDDPPNTVVKVRETRVRSGRDRKGGQGPDDDVQGVRGSTRLEAKKQRRREGRDTGRRRAPLITEAEFLARRESVERVMVVRQSGDRTQIGVLEDGVLVEHYVNRAQSASYVGNVYLGKVQNVLPSMEAAFVDIGKGRNAVLYAGEVNFDAAGVTGHAKRIESVLKSGQAVLTQVTKDPIGHKGARLTSQISLPGRYLVYVPEGTMTGISRKLPENERNRLKAILKAVVPENAGVIVRTAAEGATEDELRRDVERLSAQWEEIQRKAKSSAGTAPTLLYGEPDLTVRVVRDIFNEDFVKLIVSGDQAWDTIREYVGGVAPDLAPRLERWTSEQDVFAVHRVDEQLAKGLDRKVWLPSGGSLVIDRTEAMVVIDVNTGKFTGSGGNLEETVTRNNIEAAEEIVRQLRLRDLGGIIVIDFIDMVLESNRDLVMRRLLECLGRDRTKHQVAEVTSLGLIQMTRKRVGQGLLEAFSETCDKCNGRGVLVHMEPVPVSHGHLAEDERDSRGQQGRGGKSGGGQDRAEGAQNGSEDEHEGGRGRRKRRKSHGHADRQQHFDPQYDVDGVPEEFEDFADGEQAEAGPVTVTKATAAGDDATDGHAPEDEAAELSEHSDVEHVPSHEHVVAPVVTAQDVAAVEEADVTERLAAGDAQAHTVYAPHAEADKDETEAEAAGRSTAPVAAAVAVATGPEPESGEEAPKRRGVRVRRAAKRPAGPPTAHS